MILRSRHKVRSEFYSNDFKYSYECSFLINYVPVHVCMYVCICVSVHVCGVSFCSQCAQEPEGVKCPLSLSPYFFEVMPPSEPETCTLIRLEANKDLLPCSHNPLVHTQLRARVRSFPGMLGFYVSIRSWTLVLRIADQVFLVTEPSPQPQKGFSISNIQLEDQYVKQPNRKTGAMSHDIQLLASSKITSWVRFTILFRSRDVWIPPSCKALAAEGRYTDWTASFLWNLLQEFQPF